MMVLRCIALSLVALAMLGCPHQDDPESTDLVGTYVATNPKLLLLDSKTLVIIDAHHLRTDSGKVYRYSTDEEFFGLEAKGYEGLAYTNESGSNPSGIRFVRLEDFAGSSKNMFYRRVR